MENEKGIQVVGENALQASVKIENAVLIVSAKADLIEALREMAKKTTNTVDDKLVEMVAMARDGLDWKGYAKGIL